MMMIRNLKIGKKLAIAFGLVLTLMLCVAGAGYWGLSVNDHEVKTTMSRVQKLSRNSFLAQVGSLNLRRFEKDLFLNIGNEQKEKDYQTKWATALEEVKAAMQTMDETSSTAEDKAAIKAAQADLATYVAGYSAVKEAIKAGTVNT